MTPPERFHRFRTSPPGGYAKEREPAGREERGSQTPLSRLHAGPTPFPFVGRFRSLREGGPRREKGTFLSSPFSGPSWSLLGPSWAPLGGLLEPLGAILEPLGVLLEPLGAVKLS